MRISDVLRAKGSEVVTVRPDETVSGLLALLVDRRIGACVVTSDGTTIEGIVSERDILFKLHERGPDVLASPVAEIMTIEVTTGVPHDEIEATAGVMTEKRVRHIPVVDEEGRLAAIVSIGDIVKHRLDELQSERDQLRDYITH